MAMNIGGGSEEEQGAISTINTTPLVDVMLVLLIIFLITIPVINKTVKVDLPKAVNIPTQTKPENVTIAVDKDGNIYWNDARVANMEALLLDVKQAAGYLACTPSQLLKFLQLEPRAIAQVNQDRQRRGLRKLHSAR